MLLSTQRDGNRPKRTGALRAEAATVDSEPLLSIRAVERVCDIFDLLQDADHGMTLTEIAERVSLPKSTAYRYLAALEKRSYIERDDETNIVRLGFAFRPKPSRRMDEFIELARSALEAMRDRTGETINIGVLDGGQFVHRLVVESGHIMRLAARPGERGMIHSTAIGKVIAAQLPAERVQSILEIEGMPRLTEHTITTAPAFMTELEKVRRQGYAVDDCENQEDGRCIAVPIKGVDVAMGLSLSAPVRRVRRSDVPGLAKSLQELAGRLAAQYRSLPD
jgi:IclR family transcriptional regulator, acetate operon repressor